MRRKKKESPMMFSIQFGRDLCPMIPTPEKKFRNFLGKMREREKVEGREYLERRVRMRKGLTEMREMKREREGPSAINAYPIPAATVILSLSLS